MKQIRLIDDGIFLSLGEVVFDPAGNVVEIDYEFLRSLTITELSHKIHCLMDSIDLPAIDPESLPNV